MKKRSKHWEIRDDYWPIVAKAKKLFPTLLSHVVLEKMLFCSFTVRRSRLLARIRPNKLPWSLCMPQYDYCIETWKNRFDRASEAEQIFTIVHELFHIPPGGFNSKDRREYRRTVHHDIEDFLMLREVYGLHLDRIEDIMKGEKELLKLQNGKVRRFPRTVKIH